MPVDPNAIVDGAYCALADLRKGDIRLPSYMGDGTAYIKNAAEEIDIALGTVYVTPLEIEDIPANRPARLALKKINWLLASGRLILDLNADGSQDNMHAYGMGMLKEGLTLLKQFAIEELALIGATRLDSTDETKDFTGPTIYNQDVDSLVESFYVRRPSIAGVGYIQPQPYGVPPRLVI